MSQAPNWIEKDIVSRPGSSRPSSRLPLPTTCTRGGTQEGVPRGRTYVLTRALSQLDRERHRVKAGFIPAVIPPSITKHLHAWWHAGGGPAGEDLRPHPRLIT